MPDNTPLIPTEPDWDGTPLSRTEEILYSIIHSEEWDGTPLSRGEYLLLQVKDAIENNSMLDFKGRVDSVADLPSTGNKKGDAYSVGPEDQLNRPEYFWTGSSWEYLGQMVDLSGYLPLTGGTMTGSLTVPWIYAEVMKLKELAFEDQASGFIGFDDNDVLRLFGRDCNGVLIHADYPDTYVRAEHGATVPATDSSDKIATTAIVNSIINDKYKTSASNTQTGASYQIFNQKRSWTKSCAYEIYANIDQSLDYNKSHMQLDVSSTDPQTQANVSAAIMLDAEKNSETEESMIDLYASDITLHSGNNTATYNGVDLTVNNVAILSTLSSIQTTIGNINTVLEEVL